MSTSQVVPFTTSAPGLNAFSALMGGFTQPAVNATVDVVIRLGQWAVKGQTIFIENGGLYTVQRKILNADGSVTATISNTGASGNASPGSAIPIGDCSPAGAPGAAGAAGASSTTGGFGIGALGSGSFLRSIKGAIGAIGLGLHLGSWGTGIVDSGGGPFIWNGTDTRADNGGTIIRPDGAGVGPTDPGRWNRLYNGPLYVDWFGAYGDSTTGLDGHDDTTAIQATINVAKGVGGIVGFTAGRGYRIAGTSDPVLDVTFCAGVVLGTVNGTPGSSAAGRQGGAWLYIDSATTGISVINFRSTLHCGIDSLAIKVVTSACQPTRGLIVCANDATDFVNVGYLRIKDTLIYGHQDTIPISSVTFANPIEITTTTNHGLTSGTYIVFENMYFGGTIGGAVPPPNYEILSRSLQVTVTAPNKFTVPVDTTSYPTPFRTDLNPIVAHNTVGRLLHLGNINNAHVHHCNFAFAQIHIYGQNEGISNVVTIDGISVFSDMSKCAIANPGQAWTIAGNTFEIFPAIGTDGTLFQTQGLKMFGNWFGDGSSYTRWIDLFDPQGFSFTGNFVANSQIVAPIRIRAGAGIRISDNLMSTDHIVEFTGPETSQYIHIGPNGGYSGPDSAQIVGLAFTSNVVQEAAGLYAHTLNVTSEIFAGALETASAAPIATGSNLTLSGQLGAKPTFASGALGAMFSWQIAGFGGTPGPAISHWPPQNDTTSGHAFYAYDPAVATYQQRVTQWFGPRYNIQYGSAAFTQLKRDMCLYADTIGTGTTASLTLADGTTAFGLQNGNLYRITAVFECCDKSATPSKRYSATINALVGCTGGTAAILTQATTDVEDPDTAGWSVSLTTTGGQVTFKATNATGVTGRATCWVTSREMVTS